MAQTTYRQYAPGQFGAEVNTEVAPYPTTINNTATTIVNLGMAPRTQFFNFGFISCVTTLPTSGAALQVQFAKYDSTASFALVNLTAAQDITVTTQTLKKTFQVAALSTLTDAQRRLQPGDSLIAQFIAAGTVTGQALGAVVGAELDIIGNNQLGT